MADAIPERAQGDSPSGRLQHHFESMDQQKEASSLGMWVFLVTEILFFGGLFLAYTIYRWQNARAFAHASLHMDIALGTVNTAVLICSSLTVVLAVRAAQLGSGGPRWSIWHLR